MCVCTHFCIVLVRRNRTSNGLKYLRPSPVQHRSGSSSDYPLDPVLTPRWLEVSSGKGNISPLLQVEPQPAQWGFSSLHLLNHGCRQETQCRAFRSDIGDKV